MKGILGQVLETPEFRCNLTVCLTMKLTFPMIKNNGITKHVKEYVSC